MSKQYAPKTFLRQVRGKLINECLKRRGIVADFDLEVIKPAVVDELFERLSALAPADRATIESDFAEITELATPQGTAAILREAGRRDLDLQFVFGTAQGPRGGPRRLFQRRHSESPRAAAEPRAQRL